MDVLEFPDALAWEAWLESRHDTAGEAWLRYALILPLLKARTPRARAAALARAVGRLSGD